MITVKPPIPVIPPSARPVSVLGGALVHDAVRDLAGRAQDRLAIDGFRLTNERTVRAFADAHERGVEVDVLADSDNLDAAEQGPGTRDALRSITSVLREYGEDPFKQHSKAVVRDREEAIVATDVSDAAAESRMEFGVRFSGAGPRVLDTLHGLDADSPKRLVRNAITDARKMGILVNDAHLGVRDVSAAVFDLIDSARDGSLYLAGKALESDEVIERIVKAVDRGVSATVVANYLEPEDRELLLDGGVDVKVVDAADQQPIRLHGTALAVNGTVLITSMPLIKRAIEGTDKRQSRELGVGLAGEAGRGVADELRTIYDAVPSIAPS